MSRPSISLILLYVVTLCPFGCDRSERNELEEDPEGASAVITEGLRLTMEAKQAIGLRATPVERRSVRRSITTAGWFMAKPGHEAVIKAPVSGFFRPLGDDRSSLLGTIVEKGREIGALETFLSPQEQAQLVVSKQEADIAIRQARIGREIAAGQLERLRSAAKGAVTRVQLQSLEETVRKAEAAEEESREKLPFLPQEPYETLPGWKPVALTASLPGRVIDVHQSPRQLVIQGDPLLTVADWSTLWLRVPVFEGDLARVDQSTAAQATIAGNGRSRAAEPTGIPQPTTERRRTVDLLYEVDNRDGELRPGQSASVRLPTGDSTERLVIPRAAVVWDALGTAWVYTEQAENVFRRRRVRLGPRIDDAVVVDRGLSKGESVVTTGAEALYGEEFQGRVPLEDDD